MVLDVCVRIHRGLLEESSTAPADVTGTGRGLTGTHDVTSLVQMALTPHADIQYTDRNSYVIIRDC